jgi:hypothetical protein
METVLTQLLLGTDLRKLKNHRQVIESVHDQGNFDELFKLIFHYERALVVRAADAVEKITRKHPEYLEPHKNQLLNILKGADHKELKWHIAQLITRVSLSQEELTDVWHILTYWALNRNENKIVRVNALQGLFDISRQHPHIGSDFENTIEQTSHELIPSIQARIRKLRKIKDGL